MGFEPTNGGITIHCLNHLATPAIAILNIALLPAFDLPLRSKFLIFMIKFFNFYIFSVMLKLKSKS